MRDPSSIKSTIPSVYGKKASLVILAALCAFLLCPPDVAAFSPENPHNRPLLAQSRRPSSDMGINRGSSTEELIYVLENSQFPHKRAYAADLLLEREATEAIPSLVRAIEDPEDVVQNAAAEALVKMADETILSQMLENLDNPMPGARKYSAYVLGKLGKGKDPREIRDVIEALENKAKDPDHLVRKMIIVELAELKSDTSKSIFIDGLKDKDPDVRMHSAAALEKFKGEDVEVALAEALQSEMNQTVRSNIATALSALGTKTALKALIVVLPFEKEPLRADIAVKLGEAGTDEAVEVLADLLVSDRSSRVRETAALGLLKAKKLSTLPALASALKDRVATVRIAASEALMAFGDNSVAAELINAMGDSSDTVADNAARALVRMRDKNTIPDLIRILDHPDDGVVDRAAAVLEELTYKPYGNNTKMWKQWYKESYKKNDRQQASAEPTE